MAPFNSAAWRCRFSTGVKLWCNITLSCHIVVCRGCVWLCTIGVGVEEGRVAFDDVQWRFGWAGLDWAGRELFSRGVAELLEMNRPCFLGEAPGGSVSSVRSLGGFFDDGSRQILTKNGHKAGDDVAFGWRW